MARRAVILNSSRLLLPPKYQRVKYIQAQGDRAVIDTGVPGDNGSLQFEFKFNVDKLLMYRGLFTNYASNEANCWRFSGNSANSMLLYCVNTKAGSFGSFSISIIGQDTSIYMRNDFVSISTETQTATVTSVPTTLGTANNTTIYINSSRRYSQTRDDVIKWYYFRISDGDVLIRNYVPCYRKSDNLAGFFDTVNGTFNPSIGTEDFTYGND